MDPVNTTYYVETKRYLMKDIDFSLHSKWKDMYVFYERTAHELSYIKLMPVLYALLSLSMPLWLLLGAIFILRAKERRKAMLPLLPMVILILTYLLGPVTIFRYLFPVFVQYPLIIALALQPDRLLCIHTERN